MKTIAMKYTKLHNSPFGGFRGLFIFLAFSIIHLSFNISEAYAQTVTIYRGGVAMSPVYSSITAASAASMNGDSIVLSAHTFYEHDVPMYGGQIWQGTLTSTDTTTIDANYLGRCININPATGSKRNIIIRDIIITKGKFGGGSGFHGGGLDSVKLKGHAIVSYCHSSGVGGGVYSAFLFDYAKLTHNIADSVGGGGCFIYAFDSAEICYNTAKFGGAVGYIGAGGQFYCSSPGVRIHHNTATIGGGGIYGHCEITAGQIIYNQAPLGAAMWSHVCGPATIQNSYVYNPLPDGTRQNEVYVRSGYFNMEGSWFGKSDTLGLFMKGPTPCDPSNAIKGRYAIANWSVNWSKPITNKDTLFPIGAAFTYNDGTPLPTKSLPWLTGNFSSSTGKMLTPNPKITPTDTMSSMFRTYVYPTKGDTTSKPINFICIVDGDTFRTSPRVWGIDSIKLGITNATIETQVMVYPNPTTDFINIEGLEIGSSIELYDVMGKLMKNEKVKMNNTVLDVKLLPAGVYHLKITTKEGNVGTSKVVKD